MQLLSVTTLHTMQMGIGAADLLVRAPKLRKLSLFASKLGNHGAALIADRLASGTFMHLLELELSACEIGAEGMNRLLDVLESQAAPALEVTYCCMCFQHAYQKEQLLMYWLHQHHTWHHV
jgi:Ran GTPase-activating protein (RanGAP) involved in mRNA processing and transport